jgi:FKBP-type peptidyl-prolyl cis-trans isomerase SlyD
MPEPIIAENKMVSLTYTLRNQQGDVFEYRDLPISYLHGAASGLFEKVEHALEGRRPGDHVVVTLSPDEAFGAHDPGLTVTDDVDNVPPELRRLGMQLEAQNAKGETLTFVVTDIHDGKLTVDANHPLAGQTVTFDVTVADVRDATADEARHGGPTGDQTVPPVQ